MTLTLTQQSHADGQTYEDTQPKYVIAYIQVISVTYLPAFVVSFTG